MPLSTWEPPIAKEPKTMAITSLMVKSALALVLATTPMVRAADGMPQSIRQIVNAPVVADSLAPVEADTASAGTVSPAPEPIQAPEQTVRTYTISVTAYSSTPDQTDDTPFTTANGQTVRDGIIATNFLPFHTRVRFPQLFGDKVFTVEDRMNKRYATRADIWMESREAAIKFGLKRATTIEVLPARKTAALADAK